MRITGVEALEWEHVKTLLSRYISCPLGLDLLPTVEPHEDRDLLEADLAETGEAIAYLRASASVQSAGSGSAIRINLNGLPDVTQSVHKLRIEGTTLEPRELFDVLNFLNRAADAKSFLTAAGERFPLLARRAHAIGNFDSLLEVLEGKIAPDGSVLDSASPHLNRIRREMEKQRRAIHDSLDRFVRANRNEGVLQEEYVTIRNDRFVVPVIAGQRRKLPGVIHGASNTGQTLFLEPLETIDLNNELVRLQEEEHREIYRILKELTDRLRVFAGPIQAALGVIAILDLLFAKAKFAIDFDCCIPRFTDRTLTLKDARHPLLIDVLKRSRKKVVPFTLTLDADCRTLLISGPNTGGKTVTLKTIGLLALMAQAALPVPAAAAELPVFEQVLADIGDNQSIEQNLSTFSAHVSRLREMALDVTPNSLVLLDEIGSATDPDEGGALGVALVDHFRAAGSFAIASTHLTALKIYGANTKTVLNASMGFDELTLQPTYHLQVGLPGKSCGLDIAERMGMPEDIMRRARASLTTREIELSTLLAKLHSQLADAEAERVALEKERMAQSARHREKLLEVERREAVHLREMEARYDELKKRWEERAEDTLSKIAETSDRRKGAELAARQVTRTTREMREDFETSVIARPQALDKPEAPKQKLIEEGTRVRLKGIRDAGLVRRIYNDGRFEVEIGFMKMQASRDDIEEVLQAIADPKPKLPKGVRFQAGPALHPVAQEINVIGQHANDAVDEVERFLDAAIMATAARVRIVHGHGMGILKRAIADLLKANPHVEKFYPASSYEGGNGATIVELKD